MRNATEISLKRAIDTPRAQKRRRYNARKAFRENWMAYGERFANLLLAAYEAEQSGASVTLRARLVTGRNTANAGKDDLIELSATLRIDRLAYDDVLLKHYERLGLTDLAAAGIGKENASCKTPDNVYKP